MDKIYTYSLLKYKHSSILGECLNIGLLVYFNDNKKLKFIYPDSLSRIKNSYVGVNEKTIRNYLKQIDYKATLFNKKFDSLISEIIGYNFKEFIDNYILPPDGSSLQFENSVVNFQRNYSEDKIVEQLKHLYHFESQESRVDKEYEIGKTFYGYIKNRVNENYFYRDYEIKNPTGAKFKFKYAWQNGSLNLVKPLNFDLSEQRHIARKAHENFGLFVDLEPVAEQKDLKYDLLVIKPTKKSLYKEYDHSIKLLERVERTNIIEESEIKKYSENLIKTLSNKK
ncbi:hypothetical protein [Abyssalbus ytuae]|uniref:DUF3037 domain-containing protein n=1 Tax=Abyssalbus ytuae TaxID=2926907 RepID=A0A9E6ZM03_9FLAO|nr:hypothetical protein [Abyssalbus ytuae]UOB17119.1 hypothetical protein MQE35_15430 [Abyssalbus ytuae]